MKHIIICLAICICVSSCSLIWWGKQELAINLNIPENYREIDNSQPIKVNGEEVSIVWEKLKVWDILKTPALDKKADYFDQVETWSIDDFSWYRLIETVPSLDTPVCTMQTKQLEFATTQFPDISFFVISNDTPFALQRFCSANGIDNLEVMSDARTREFWRQNGLLLEKYALLTRAIMIIDADNRVQYIEYADEVTSELDLMNALAFLRTVTQNQ